MRVTTAWWLVMVTAEGVGLRESSQSLQTGLVQVAQDRRSFSLSWPGIKYC